MGWRTRHSHSHVVYRSTRLVLKKRRGLLCIRPFAGHAEVMSSDGSIIARHVDGFFLLIALLW